MSDDLTRKRLPRASDRLALGSRGLAVSPICIGCTASAATIITAFEEGINFFFVSADMHWPSYEQTRQGIITLLAGNERRRSEIVVAAVSYLAMPLFEQAGQFREVIAAIPGLKYLDVLIAGWTIPTLMDRVACLRDVLQTNVSGVRGVGASFHHRPSALAAIREASVDIAYLRYNPCHPGARADLLAQVTGSERALIYNFKSMMYPLTPDQFANVLERDREWLPECSDYYRFALSHPRMSGLLCSPGSPKEVKTLVGALQRRPLSALEQNYMIRLSQQALPKTIEQLNRAWSDSTEDVIQARANAVH